MGGRGRARSRRRGERLGRAAGDARAGAVACRGDDDCGRGGVHGADRRRDLGRVRASRGAAPDAVAAPPRAPADPRSRPLPAGRARAGGGGARGARGDRRRGTCMKWVTRSHCHIDRAACAWLIRRFIDAGAEFSFVDDPEDVDGDAIPFDMRGAELSHHAGDCTFETFLRRYELHDPILWDLARIVHEADLADERYDAPEARGLDAAVRGLSIVVGDTRLLEITGPLLDG